MLNFKQIRVIFRSSGVFFIFNFLGSYEIIIASYKNIYEKDEINRNIGEINEKLENLVIKIVDLGEKY